MSVIGALDSQDAVWGRSVRGRVLDSIGVMHTVRCNCHTAPCAVALDGLVT